MIQLRKSKDRGHFDHGWLKTFHTFSFSDYHDPKFMGFRSLRVINEDWIQADEGFGTHPHRDMEIVTYMIEGELAHKDSMGNGSIIRAGDAQYMSAGSGVTHSEFNPSQKEAGHLLQIWILPQEKSAKPRYDQKNFKREDKLEKLKLIASPDGSDQSIAIRQDAQIFASILPQGKSLRKELQKDRFAWVQLIRGSITVNGQTMSPGDGAAIGDEKSIQIQGIEGDAEFLLFDLD